MRSHADLHVWFDKTRSAVSMVTFGTKGMTTQVSFSIDVSGVPAGIYPLVIHVLKDGKLLKNITGQDLILELPDLEVRDMSVPALIPGAIAPTEGRVEGGTLIVIGVSGVASLLAPEAKALVNEALKFTMREEDAAAGDGQQGTVVAGPLSIEDVPRNFNGLSIGPHQ